MKIENYLFISSNGKKKLVRPKQWDKSKKSWKPNWDVIEFCPYHYDKTNVETVALLIRQQLTANLLSPTYLEKNIKNPLFGHCFHATQAMYYTLDTSSLVSIRGQDVTGEYHWWLGDVYTNEIIDITAGQFDEFDYPPPYDNGKETPWYTFKGIPKKQTLDLIQKIQPTALRYSIANPFTNYNTLDDFL